MDDYKINISIKGGEIFIDEKKYCGRAAVIQLLKLIFNISKNQQLVMLMDEAHRKKYTITEVNDGFILNNSNNKTIEVRSVYLHNIKIPAVGMKVEDIDTNYSFVSLYENINKLEKLMNDM
jgi:hypothetical protein